MSFSQPTGGRKLTVRTSLVLTVLVCVSLLGAVVVEWNSPPPTNPTPIGNTLVPVGATAAVTLPTPDPSIVRSRDYGLWGYVATRNTQGLAVDLKYNYNTAKELKDYVAMNDKRITALANDGGMVDVLVTFKWPVKPGDFRTWAAKRGLEAALVSLRLSGKGGVHGTLTVAGRAGDPLPQDKLDAVGIESTLPPIEGVYSVRGSVPAGVLPTMVADPAVFVADVTPTLTRIDMVASGIPDAQEAPIHCESPFDDAAKWGLAHVEP